MLVLIALDIAPPQGAAAAAAASPDIPRFGSVRVRYQRGSEIFGPFLQRPKPDPDPTWPGRRLRVMMHLIAAACNYG